MWPGPCSQFAMLWMASILQRLEQILIAANAAAIFRRAGAFPIPTPWSERVLCARPAILDRYAMVPAITKIIFVDKAGPFFGSPSNLGKALP